MVLMPISNYVSLKNKSLGLFIFFIAAVCVAVFANNVILQFLNKNEIAEEIPIMVSPTDAQEYTGIVRYTNPKLYPNDNISYYLDVGPENDILLKASDEKLTVVEGLNVSVSGKLSKTVDGKKDVLLVEKVTVKNR